MPDGPLLVEGSRFPEHDILQLPPRMSPIKSACSRNSGNLLIYKIAFLRLFYINAEKNPVGLCSDGIFFKIELI